MAEEVQKKRSPWVYVGVGCAAAVVLSCGFVVIAGFAGFQALKGWGEDLQDPARRESKARKEALATLGAVPEGYSAALTIGFPMVFDMILFIDAPLLADGGVPEFTRQFMFMRFMETERTADMKAFFESDGGVAFQSDNVQLDAKEELARGNFQHAGRLVRWVAMKGRVRTQNQFDRDEDSILTTMLFECPDNGQVRMATWQMREPEGTWEAKGTVADPEEMKKLLSLLLPCGK
ncbi:MAG: hypothetical protein JNK82_33565 [Myxococcaceae bacterium]|nr:hypothetical protein [Myxococcaceae bacterium]